MTTSTFAPSYLPGQGKLLEPLPPGSHIAIVGAGAFGGWTALHLLKRKYVVTLIDAWGSGNSRSSSGDETRVIRSTYGANRLYFDMNVRALQLWKAYEQIWKKNVFENKGVLWLCYQEHTPIVDDSIPFANEHQMEYERLSVADIQRRYPIVNTADLSHAWFDPYGGCLQARESCQLVLHSFADQGGIYLQANARPGRMNKDRMTDIMLAEGSHLKADAFIFACGSWLGALFPEVLGKVITCSKQEVYYFGTPAEHAQAFDSFPVWVDADGNDFYYGIPGNTNRGFKIGVDRRGESFDPSTGDRTHHAEVLQRARDFVNHRFPGMRNAPLIENRVCPYENSPDGNFLFDHHPHAHNLFFLGGGSGHGFKHGPALGELVSACISGEQSIPSDFLLRHRMK